MFTFPTCLFSASGGLINAIDWNGSTSALRSNVDLSGQTDGSTGLISFWFRLDAGDGVRQFVMANDSEGNAWFQIMRESSNKFRVVLVDSTGALSMIFLSNSTYTASSTWRHCAINFNTNAIAGSKTHQIYIDGASDLGTVTDLSAAFNVNFASAGGFSVGCDAAAAVNFNGCLAEVYCAFNQSLDISNSTNLEKFRTAAGLPANLGSDGSTPTGTAPTYYLKSTAANALTNSGSGGAMTSKANLADCSSSPA